MVGQPWPRRNRVEEKDDTHHAHALPRREQRRNTDQERQRRHDPPCPSRRAHRQQHGGEDAADDARGAEPAREEHPRPVAVADGPADEVGVGLAAQRPLDGAQHVLEGRGVRRRGERAQQALALFRRQVQLARRALGDVGGDDTLDFFAVRLDGDCGAERQSLAATT